MTNHGPTMRLFALGIYGLIGWTYAQFFWLGEDKLPIVRLWVESTIERPYTYRQLIPIVTRELIQGTGLPMDLAFVLVITASFIAAVSMMGVFLREFGAFSERQELWIAAGLGVGRLHYANPYDFATIATFSLCLLLLYRRQFGGYLVIFFLACLNRETTFLLILFFAVHFFHALARSDYLRLLLAQLGIFLAVRLAMLAVFRDQPGVVAQVNLLRNLEEWTHYPLGTLALLMFFALVGWLVGSSWTRSPLFVRHVIVTFTPPLLVMWIGLGRAFELRVFLELLPVLVVLLLLKRQSAPLPSALAEHSQE